MQKQKSTHDGEGNKNTNADKKKHADVRRGGSRRIGEAEVSVQVTLIPTG